MRTNYKGKEKLGKQSKDGAKESTTGSPLERQILGTTNLEGEEGDPQEEQELGENRDLWNSSLSPRTGQDGGLRGLEAGPLRAAGLGAGARTHTYTLTDFGQAGHQDPQGHQVGRLYLVPLPAEERQAWRRLTQRHRLLSGFVGVPRPRQGQPERQKQCGAQHPAACFATLSALYGRRPRVAAAAAAAYPAPPRHRHVGLTPPNPGSDTPQARFGPRDPAEDSCWDPLLHFF